MECFEYIKMPFRWIPKEIRIQYSLYSLVEPDGYVYLKVRKGIYGIKQAARLTFGNLVKLLSLHGYFPVQESLDFCGNIRPVSRCLPFALTTLVSNSIQWRTHITSCPHG